MITYFTSDFHLFHDNGIKVFSRPFADVDEMWEVIKSNWNNTVTPEDDVWFLGDLTLKGRQFLPKLTEMIHSLNGTKFLVRGNHDKFTDSEYRDMGFSDCMNFGELSYGPYMYHDPQAANELPSGDILLCGHVHNQFRTLTTLNGIKIFNVGVDANNFAPITYETIMYILRGLKQ